MNFIENKYLPGIKISFQVLLHVRINIILQSKLLDIKIRVAEKIF